MGEDVNKVVTSFRLAPETVDAIERLAKIDGKGKGEFIDFLVESYDAPVIKTGVREPSEGATIQFPIPRDRQMLIDAFGNVIASVKDFIHEREIWAAFTEGRQRFQRALPEYKAAEKMRQEWQERRERASQPLTYTKKGASLS